MKRYISSSSRGNGIPKDPDKQKLRIIVNDIYDEVESQELTDYPGLIKSAGKKYHVDWWRTKEGLFDQNEADAFYEDVQRLVDDLGYHEYSDLSMKKEEVALDKPYGYTMYTVRLTIHP